MIGHAEPSLEGFTIGITADRRWEEQAELLRRRGASVVHAPTIRTLPLGSEDDLRIATEQLVLDPPDILVANTGIGMRAWLSAAESWGIGEALTHALRSAAIFARGPKASAAVHHAGLNVVACAESEQMDGLIALLIASGVEGRRVAFQRHGDASPDPIRALRDAGASVVEVPIYRWILPDDTTAAERLVEAVVSGRVQAVTFTSAPAVRNLVAIAAEGQRDDALIAAFRSGAIACAVGPVCAAAARGVGITGALMPDKYRLGPMIRALTESLVGQESTSTLGGVPVALRGAAVLVDGSSVHLSTREADLLRALLVRRPAVVSKRELVELVWRGAGDGHLVEVTIGRLRKRLGAAGAGIVSVPRRGYLART